VQNRKKNTISSNNVDKTSDFLHNKSFKDVLEVLGDWRTIGALPLSYDCKKQIKIKR
jgi:hypothetical protein